MIGRMIDEGETVPVVVRFRASPGRGEARTTGYGPARHQTPSGAAARWAADGPPTASVPSSRPDREPPTPTLGQGADPLHQSTDPAPGTTGSSQRPPPPVTSASTSPSRRAVGGGDPVDPGTRPRAGDRRRSPRSSHAQARVADDLADVRQTSRRCRPGLLDRLDQRAADQVVRDGSRPRLGRIQRVLLGLRDHLDPRLVAVRSGCRPSAPRAPRRESRRPCGRTYRRPVSATEAYTSRTFRERHVVAC